MKKKIVMMLLTATLTLSTVIGAYAAELEPVMSEPVAIESVAIEEYSETIYDSEQTHNVTATASAMSIASRSKGSIIRYINEHPVDFNSRDKYAVEPVYTNGVYEPGKLAESTVANALTAVNNIRYIAGLSGVVGIDDTYMEKAQAGALINAANRSLSHTPSKPAGMSEELYQLGYSGTSSSNIAMGYYNLVDSIVYGYMEDADPGNIPMVGHRRWILNPGMKATGFGSVSNSYTMYAFDSAFAKTGEYGVAWPARNMPVEYFGTNWPWSISFGSIVSTNVKVTLTDLNTGKSWNFSSSSADGAFYNNGSNYGQKGCLIFRPKEVISYKSGDRYRVDITGIGISGMSDSLSYNVDFFSLSDEIVEKNGLTLDADGIWRYYEEDNIKADYTGLVNYNGTLFYVTNGVLNNNYTGFVNYDGKNCYVFNGVVYNDYTGLVYDSSEWVYVKNSIRDNSYTGLVYYIDSWFYVVSGKVDFNYTGLVLYDNVWFSVINGVLDFNYTGLSAYDGYLFYVTNGILNNSYTGLVYYNGEWLYAYNGVVDNNYTGLCYYIDSWYYVSGGRVDFTYSSLAYHEGSWYCISNGRVNFDYTGLVFYVDTWFYVKNGVLDFNYTGTCEHYGYYYNVVNGIVIF